MRYFCFWLGCCALGNGLVLAQPVLERKKEIQEPPQVAMVKTATPPLPPVDFFRQLLAMPPAEQERALAQRPEGQRKRLQEKVREYSLLPREERDSRLQLIQLYLYLPPLMRLAPAGRTNKLDTLPAEDRRLIEERLELWDRLPPDLQKEVLDHEKTLIYFLGLESGPPAQPQASFPTPPAGYKQADEKLEQWQALPLERRQKMYEHFRRFFELPPKQKEKTLEALSERERLQMEQSLQTFERLPTEQRNMCIESFRQFANLSQADRDQFLKNAERWKAMSPRERETWRNLISLFPNPGPPMPPGVPGGKPSPPLGKPFPGNANMTNLPPLPGFQPGKR